MRDDNRDLKMSLPITDEKGDIGPKHVKKVHNNAALPQQTHYEARSDDEKRLDRRVNLKLDLIVVFLLGLEFIVSFNLEEDIT